MDRTRKDRDDWRLVSAVVRSTIVTTGPPPREPSSGHGAAEEAGLLPATPPEVSPPADADAVTAAPMAFIHLFDPETAPGYRNSLAERSHFTVTDFGDNIAGVVPVEGPGEVADYFKLVKLADASSNLDDPALLAPLRDLPPRLRSDVDPDEYMAHMEQRVAAIQEEVNGFHADLVAFALYAFGAAQRGDLDALIRAQLPFLFENFPSGTLWYVQVSDVLLARLAFTRSQLALSLLPDLPVGEDMEQLDSLQDLTLTKGVDISAALNVPLVVLSPSVLGFQVPATPHALVFCFGDALDLRLPYPTSLSSLYRPRVLDDPEGLNQPDFLAAADTLDGEQLLGWWVERLNRIYSHVCDPTRFVDDDRRYDANSQAAWHISVERMLGDLTSVLAEPQATELDRVQLAFDLLDKAEGLLGYGRQDSSKGFQALLRRKPCVRMLRAAFASMPARLAQRCEAEATRLFDELYAAVRDNTVSYRLTATGVRVSNGHGELVVLQDEAYVPRLIRAVRNSSHGLLDVLRDHPDRYLLATNTGGIPAEFPALVALIGIALIADVEGLIDGTARQRLQGKV